MDLIPISESSTAYLPDKERTKLLVGKPIYQSMLWLVEAIVQILVDSVAILQLQAVLIVLGGYNV